MYWKFFDVSNLMLSTMFQPHLCRITHNHIGVVFPRFRIYFEEDFLFLVLDHFCIDGWWEVWYPGVRGSIFWWIQVVWHILHALRLNFDILSLVEEMGSKLKGPVMDVVSDTSTMSAHCIYFYNMVCGLVEIGCVVDKYVYLRKDL